MFRSLPLLSCLLPLAACANGGSNKPPQSQVKIAANHHLFGFRSQTGFGTFPVQPQLVLPDRGTLALNNDSTYTLTRPGSSSGSDNYALGNDGALSIFVTGTGRDPTIVFSGGYGLRGENHELFFTDRVSTVGSPSLGVYFGTRVIPGQAELAGDWHLLSLHVVFAQTLLSPTNVARGAHGGISIAAGSPGTERAVSGAGTESGGVALVLGGSIQNLLQNNTGDGTCNLTVSYQQGTATPDSRTMFAAAGKDIVLALDADATDGESGMLFLVRKFDAPTTPADISRVAGEFLVGGYTVFVNPTSSGADAFVGRLALTQQGGFRLDAIGSRGIDFAYAGTFTLAADGGLSLTVNGTNEHWFAAMHPDYNTVVLVDDEVENRSNNRPELNLVFGVRVQTPP